MLVVVARIRSEDPDDDDTANGEFPKDPPPSIIDADDSYLPVYCFPMKENNTVISSSVVPTTMTGTEILMGKEDLSCSDFFLWKLE